jgi:hypothetical protein
MNIVQSHRVSAFFALENLLELPLTKFLRSMWIISCGVYTGAVQAAPLSAFSIMDVHSEKAPRSHLRVKTTQYSRSAIGSDNFVRSISNNALNIYIDSSTGKIIHTAYEDYYYGL